MTKTLCACMDHRLRLMERDFVDIKQCIF